MKLPALIEVLSSPDMLGRIPQMKSALVNLSALAQKLPIDDAGHFDHRDLYEKESAGLRLIHRTAMHVRFDGKHPSYTRLPIHFKRDVQNFSRALDNLGTQIESQVASIERKEKSKSWSLRDLNPLSPSHRTAAAERNIRVAYEQLMNEGNEKGILHEGLYTPNSHYTRLMESIRDFASKHPGSDTLAQEISLEIAAVIVKELQARFQDLNDALRANERSR